MLLGNVVSFTVHFDFHAEITIWVIILISILIFLSNLLDMTTNIHN